MVGLLKGIGALKVSLMVKVLAYRVVRRPSCAGYTRQREPDHIGQQAGWSIIRPAEYDRGGSPIRGVDPGG